MMQQNSHVHFVLFFLVLLLSSFSVTSARLLVPKQGEKEVEPDDMAQAWSSTELKDDMVVRIPGSEEGDEKDEECSSRRMIAEAHLDYIYTQNLKP